MIRELKRSIREKVKLAKTLFVVDIVNYCSLKCPSCPIGSFHQSRGGTLMSIDLFRRILDKAEKETKVHHIQLYSFSDACLHPDAHLFVQECTQRGIKSYISTMLQKTRCDFRKVIEARPTEFRISFPGWKGIEYYQKGAKADRFMRGLDEVCSLPRHPETLWTMAFHVYNDNKDEFWMVKALAEKHCLKLVAIPAIFMVPEKIVSKQYTAEDKELISRLLETPEECIGGMKKIGNYCHCWDQICLDANGQVYLCQLVYEDKFMLVNFLDYPIADIRRAIREHSFCSDCMRHGIHAYNELYADFTKSDDPIGDMDRMHHKERPLLK